jgi:hypothetical protein
VLAALAIWWLNRRRGIKTNGGASMTTSNSIGIALGRFIDLAQYDEIARLANERLPSDDYKKSFGAAWNGLGYRARGADEHSSSYGELWSTEPATTHETRLYQEREFFAAVTNISSAAEAFSFAAHVLAMAYAREPLTKANLKRVWPAMLVRIQNQPETAPIGKFIAKEYADTASVSLEEIRDFLIHRGGLPRSHWVGGPHHGTATVASNPKAAPADWMPDLTLNAQTLAPWTVWLKQYLAGGLPMMRAALQAV